MAPDADNQMDSFPISVLSVGLRLWGDGDTRVGAKDWNGSRRLAGGCSEQVLRPSCWRCKQIAAASLGEIAPLHAGAGTRWF